VFQVNPQYTQTLQIAHYNLLGLAEGFGGIAVLVFYIARCLVGVFESRMMESELISNFY
jgi:hypothetical protein